MYEKCTGYGSLFFYRIITEQFSVCLLTALVYVSLYMPMIEEGEKETQTYIHTLCRGIVLAGSGSQCAAETTVNMSLR